MTAATYPIPDEALDDRLAFVGTSGSGKTYKAGAALERLLRSGARGVIVDPLGVWWGLRMKADGKTASPFKVVIFGGPHADLPLTENAGALIGEAAATMAESCIVDLSEIGTAAGERRFMLGFLRALYKHQKPTGQLVHLVLDEADMWAPETIRDKEGDANKLFAITERIIRRGRIDGFIPWQITQRTAELSKSVLSMADGMIAMKLTSPQDRNALDSWIKGQADVEEGKRIKAQLPTLKIEQGVIWVPGRGILETASFPKKTTFDSSRAPKRGETKRTLKLKPLDVGALKEKLAKVESESAASDPAKLKARIAELERQTKASPAGKTPIAAVVAPSPAAIAAAEKRGYAQGVVEGQRLGIPKGEKAGAEAAFKAAGEALQRARREYEPTPAAAPRPAPATAPVALAAAKIASPAALRQPPAGGGTLTGPQLAVLGALAWWRKMGHDAPLKNQVAAIVGWSPKGSNLRCRLSDLRVLGMIEGSGDRISLTAAGTAAAPEPPAIASCLEGARAILSGPQLQVFNAIETGEPITRDDLAAAVDWEPTGSNLRCRLSDLRVLALIEGDASGFKLADWVRA